MVESIGGKDRLSGCEQVDHQFEDTSSLELNEGFTLIVQTTRHTAKSNLVNLNLILSHLVTSFKLLLLDVIIFNHFIQEFSLVVASARILNLFNQFSDKCETKLSILDQNVDQQSLLLLNIFIFIRRIIAHNRS